MNILYESLNHCPYDKEKTYLKKQYPSEEVEWIVLVESGFYGLTDSAVPQYTSADDDKPMVIGISRS